MNTGSQRTGHYKPHLAGVEDGNLARGPRARTATNRKEERKMSEIDYQAVLETLAEATDRPLEEIDAEIQALIEKEGYSLAGAITVWKSDNRFNMNVGKQLYTARVLCKEPKRTATTRSGETSVANVHFAYTNGESGEVEFNQSAVWGEERIDELFDQFDLGHVYTFEASLNNKENLSRIAKIEEAADDAAPTLLEIDPMPIVKLIDKVDEYEFIRGWVGRIIAPKDGGEAVGFEVGDNDSLLPCTVWFAGKYTKMTPEAIDEVRSKLAKSREVGVYGYTSVSGNDTSMNASSVWFMDE